MYATIYLPVLGGEHRDLAERGLGYIEKTAICGQVNRVWVAGQRKASRDLLLLDINHADAALSACDIGQVGCAAIREGCWSNGYQWPEQEYIRTYAYQICKDMFFVHCNNLLAPAVLACVVRVQKKRNALFLT